MALGAFALPWIQSARGRFPIFEGRAFYGQVFRLTYHLADIVARIILKQLDY